MVCIYFAQADGEPEMEPEDKEKGKEKEDAKDGADDSVAPTQDAVPTKADDIEKSD